ncbi:MAG: V-type H(+)-translocating pyrophosphatase [Bacteroidia bacterium]
MENVLVSLSFGTGVLGLIYTVWRSKWVLRQEEGLTAKMRTLSDRIHAGARAFLFSEYRVLIVFVAVVAVLLGVTSMDSWLIGVSFLVGALFSSLAGYIGMSIATRANARTTAAATRGLSDALRVAFAGGSVMGLTVVALGIAGLSGLLYVYQDVLGWDSGKALNVLTGFSFGASSVALFARVGGGIYTKAADVGADLVGKVEAGIPEDHPLNPATIADNVGDNVGDVAGMGADLFESYVGALLSSMILGGALAYATSNPIFVFYPLALGASGILASLVGTFFVRVSEKGNPQTALNTGMLIAAVIFLALTVFCTFSLLPESWAFQGQVYTPTNLLLAVGLGLVVGILVGFVTEYYTGLGKSPVKFIARQSLSGVATNIIAGLGMGMLSTALPTMLIVVGIVGAYYLSGLYGIALAAVGMLANTGIQLAVDAYGPIADNAGGIAEMSHQPKEVRSRTDTLDAVGNTTAAIGKGFAIASAALTALSLFAAYITASGLTQIDLSKPSVVAGLLLGGMLPFVFSALAMLAVGRAAMAMVQEVRRQFREIAPLREALAIMQKDESTRTPEEHQKLEKAEESAEYARCVEISTRGALREMILPGVLAVVAPIVVGGILGKEALGGLLAGVTVSGVMLAIFQANAGGAWDNAKKSFEAGVQIEGQTYYKGSEPHKAAVVGDTVGDPLKDTSGPSINILIKLISVIALVIAPLL